MHSIKAAFAFVACLLAAPVAQPAEFGHVAFANSGAAAAQADFLAGLAALHDFEYDSAAAAFRRAESADPQFALAYWGEAMTYNHPVWMEQDLGSARAALDRLAASPALRRAKAPTQREQAYLDAVEVLYGPGTKEDRDMRYATAMDRLHALYPDDIDAAAFYGLAILGSAHAGRDTATYMRAAAILEEAWIGHHDHPGLLHYLIHSYDDPTHAPLGLRAARRYAAVAPDAGHAQHMTSHIFLALGMWQATVDANVAAIEAADHTRVAAGRPPVACGHYPSWLEYAHLQLGNPEAARRTLAACRAALQTALSVEQHPGHSQDPDNSLSGSFANMKLRYLLETSDWGGAVAGWPVPQNAGPGARLDDAFANALGAIARGPRAAAHAALGELETAARTATAAEEQRHDPDPTGRVRPQVFVYEARGLLAEQDHDLSGAEAQLRQALALEATVPVAFGPPVIDQPAHELLGEFLLRHGRPAEAGVEFAAALASAPGRRLATRGLEAAAPRAGN